MLPQQHTSQSHHHLIFSHHDQISFPTSELNHTDIIPCSLPHLPLPTVTHYDEYYYFRSTHLPPSLQPLLTPSTSTSDVSYSSPSNSNSECVTPVQSQRSLLSQHPSHPLHRFLTKEQAQLDEGSTSLSTGLASTSSIASLAIDVPIIASSSMTSIHLSPITQITQPLTSTGATLPSTYSLLHPAFQQQQQLQLQQQQLQLQQQQQQQQQLNGSPYQLHLLPQHKAIALQHHFVENLVPTFPLEFIEERNTSGMIVFSKLFKAGVVCYNLYKDSLYRYSCSLTDYPRLNHIGTQFTDTMDQDLQDQSSDDQDIDVTNNRDHAMDDCCTTDVGDSDDRANSSDYINSTQTSTPTLSETDESSTSTPPNSQQVSNTIVANTRHEREAKMNSHKHLFNKENRNSIQSISFQINLNPLSSNDTQSTPPSTSGSGHQSSESDSSSSNYYETDSPSSSQQQQQQQSQLIPTQKPRQLPISPLSAQKLHETMNNSTPFTPSAVVQALSMPFRDLTNDQQRVFNEIVVIFVPRLIPPRYYSKYQYYPQCIYDLCFDLLIPLEYLQRHLDGDQDEDGELTDDSNMVDYSDSISDRISDVSSLDTDDVSDDQDENSQEIVIDTTVVKWTSANPISFSTTDSDNLTVMIEDETTPIPKICPSISKTNKPSLTIATHHLISHSRVKKAIVSASKNIKNIKSLKSIAKTILPFSHPFIKSTTTTSSPSSIKMNHSDSVRSTVSASDYLTRSTPPSPAMSTSNYTLSTITPTTYTLSTLNSSSSCSSDSNNVSDSTTEFDSTTHQLTINNKYPSSARETRNHPKASLKRIVDPQTGQKVYKLACFDADTIIATSTHIFKPIKTKPSPHPFLSPTIANNKAHIDTKDKKGDTPTTTGSTKLSTTTASTTKQSPAGVQNITSSTEKPQTERKKRQRKAPPTTLEEMSSSLFSPGFVDTPFYDTYSDVGDWSEYGEYTDTDITLSPYLTNFLTNASELPQSFIELNTSDFGDDCEDMVSILLATQQQNVRNEQYNNNINLGNTPHIQSYSHSQSKPVNIDSYNSTFTTPKMTSPTIPIFASSVPQFLQPPPALPPTKSITPQALAQQIRRKQAALATATQRAMTSSANLPISISLPQISQTASITSELILTNLIAQHSQNGRSSASSSNNISANNMMFNFTTPAFLNQPTAKAINSNNPSAAHFITTSSSTSSLSIPLPHLSSTSTSSKKIDKNDPHFDYRDLHHDLFKISTNFEIIPRADPKLVPISKTLPIQAPNVSSRSTPNDKLGALTILSSLGNGLEKLDRADRKRTPIFGPNSTPPSSSPNSGNVITAKVSSTSIPTTSTSTRHTDATLFANTSTKRTISQKKSLPTLNYTHNDHNEYNNNQEFKDDTEKTRKKLKMFTPIDDTFLFVSLNDPNFTTVIAGTHIPSRSSLTSLSSAIPLADPTITKSTQHSSTTKAADLIPLLASNIDSQSSTNTHSTSSTNNKLRKLTRPWNQSKKSFFTLTPGISALAFHTNSPRTSRSHSHQHTTSSPSSPKNSTARKSLSLKKRRTIHASTIHAPGSIAHNGQSPTLKKLKILTRARTTSPRSTRSPRAARLTHQSPTSSTSTQQTSNSAPQFNCQV